VSSLSTVLHVTSWLSRSGGGIPSVIWSLAHEMKLAGVDCCVAGLADRWSGTDIPDSVTALAGRVRGPTSFGYSQELDRRLAFAVRAGGVVHVHGLWMYPGRTARRHARAAQCPLIISPHGMLEPWAIQNSRWKKRVAAWLFENRNLRAANCLHALCSAEAENFRRLGLRNPIAIISNGVAIPGKLEMGNETVAGGGPPSQIGDQTSLAALRAPRPGGNRRVLLFLSRLHPKKGLENLLTAWGAIQRTPHWGQRAEDWELVVAGSGSPEYEQALKQLTADCQLTASVRFIGSVYGQEKQALLAGASAFVLPSHSEGFSMAVLEAAAAGLPVVLTRECNFPELAAAGGGLEVAPTATAIETGLRQLLSLSAPERTEMGNRARALVSKSYTWPVVADRMLSVYRWLLCCGPKPACVV
jgi:poly(glycerol-phosphate) alpha-glucosyltransferase